jgi:hypothetical protein
MQPRRPRRPAISTSLEGGWAACALEGVAGIGCVVCSAALRLAVPLYRVHAPCLRGALRVQAALDLHGLCGYRTLGEAEWAAVQGEAWSAVRGAPARVEPRRAQARPGGGVRAAAGVCGADPKTASDCRAVCGGRHLPGSDTSLTSTSRVSRTVLPDWGPAARKSTDEARRRHARAAAAAAHPSVHFAARLRAQLDSDYSRAVVVPIFSFPPFPSRKH